jgi:hypothetical protein
MGEPARVLNLSRFWRHGVAAFEKEGEATEQGQGRGRDQKRWDDPPFVAVREECARPPQPTHELGHRPVKRGLEKQVAAAAGKHEVIERRETAP